MTITGLIIGDRVMHLQKKIELTFKEYNLKAVVNFNFDVRKQFYAVLNPNSKKIIIFN
jgi:hypothetical protein